MPLTRLTAGNMLDSDKPQLCMQPPIPRNSNNQYNCRTRLTVDQRGFNSPNAENRQTRVKTARNATLGRQRIPKWQKFPHLVWLPPEVGGVCFMPDKFPVASTQQDDEPSPSRNGTLDIDTRSHGDFDTRASNANDQAKLPT